MNTFPSQFSVLISESLIYSVMLTFVWFKLLYFTKSNKYPGICRSIANSHVWFCLFLIQVLMPFQGEVYSWCLRCLFSGLTSNSSNSVLDSRIFVKLLCPRSLLSLRTKYINKLNAERDSRWALSYLRPHIHDAGGGWDVLTILLVVDLYFIRKLISLFPKKINYCKWKSDGRSPTCGSLFIYLYGSLRLSKHV